MPEVGIQNIAAKRTPRLKHRSNREKKKTGEENTKRASKAVPHPRQDRSLLVLAVFVQPPVTASVVTIHALRLHVRHERLRRLSRAHRVRRERVLRLLVELRQRRRQGVELGPFARALTSRPLLCSAKVEHLPYDC